MHRSPLWSITCSILLSTGAAQANTLVVNSLGDGTAAACAATCRLRDALSSANATDTIVFDPALTASATPNAPAVITMSSGEFVVNKNLTITGPGADLLVLDANASGRVLHVSTATTATVGGLTLRNGSVTSAANANGGGVLVDAGCALTLTGVTVRGNKSLSGSGTNAANGTGQPGSAGFAAAGGGVYSAGTLTLRDSALLDNEARGGQGGNGGSGANGGFGGNGGNGGVGGSGGAATGGGLYGTNTTTLVNVTFAGNAVYGGKGGNGGAGGMGGSGGSDGANAGGGSGGNARGGGVYVNTATAGAEIAFATFAAQVATPGLGGTSGGSGASNGPNGTISGLSLYGNGAGGVVLRGSVLADVLSSCGGTYSTTAQNLQAGIACLGFSVSNTDPKFSPINWNGGRTPNLLPRKGSAVLDAAANCSSAGGPVNNDQRALARPSDGNGDSNAVCDLGAVESDRLFDDGFEGT